VELLSNVADDINHNLLIEIVFFVKFIVHFVFFF
jgi:hypothetical protein